MTRYLADSSIWAWARKEQQLEIRRKLAERFVRNQIVTTEPVVLETMHRARTGGEYARIFRDIFEPVGWLPFSAEAAERAVEVQRELSQRSHGNHLRPAIDFLVAAVAEVAGPEYAIWCLDKDLEIICAHTGQPCESERST